MTDDEMVRRALEELRELTTCRCHPAFKERKLHDPDCDCDSAEAVGVVADRIEALTAERDALKAGQIDAIRAALEAAVDAVHCECWTDGDQGGNATPELIAEQATTELAIRAIRALDPAAIAAKLKGGGDDRA